MKKTLLAFMYVLSFSFQGYAGPKCLSGAELPFQQVFNEKTGLDKALELTQAVNPLDLNYMDAVCNSICNGNKESFLNSIVAMMDQVKGVKGTSDDKIKLFFSSYYDDAYCEAKLVTSGSSKTCAHEGENFLRTAYIDRVDAIIDQMILVNGVDLNRKDEEDQLSTVEWLNGKCKDQSLLAADRKYFCNVLPSITCRAYKQLPKDQQKAPPKGCQV